MGWFYYWYILTIERVIFSISILGIIIPAVYFIMSIVVKRLQRMNVRVY